MSSPGAAGCKGCKELHLVFGCNVRHLGPALAFTRLPCCCWLGSFFTAFSPGINLDAVSVLLMAFFHFCFMFVFILLFLEHVVCAAALGAGCCVRCAPPATRVPGLRTDEHRAIKGLLKSALLRGRNLCPTNGSGNSILQPLPPGAPPLCRRGGQQGRRYDGD